MVPLCSVNTKYRQIMADQYLSDFTSIHCGGNHYGLCAQNPEFDSPADGD